ncbi:BON domain-containing protein [Dechloromonas sp. H13]|uniref:BON domain-containing protein n=1 Tax=Dechloromonas sp. H13 TaxID=2570193 RepID=UPI0012912AAD|nr:BON domain-containing protein [Dechloromonas sp. H13]
MSKRYSAAIALFAVSLSGGIGLTAFAIDNPQGMAATVEAPDATLNERIETLLRTDIGLAGGQFRVNTRAGVVTIGGTVPDENALRRALDLASSVKGVREIRSGMVVDAPK